MEIRESRTGSLRQFSADARQVTLVGSPLSSHLSVPVLCVCVCVCAGIPPSFWIVKATRDYHTWLQSTAIEFSPYEIELTIALGSEP